jgi:hypothetical protein
MKKAIGMFGAVAALSFVLWTALQAAKEPAVGQPAPDFSLTDTEGAKHTLAQHRGKFVVLEWVNHGCPFVKKHYDSGNMQALQKETATKGVVWFSICSSAKGKQGHFPPAEWNKIISEKGMASAAVLLDETGRVGKAYGAKTTPHMYVINPQGVLIYKGAIDDRPTTNSADVNGAKNYVRAALEQAMTGQPVTTASTQAYGCSVKYQ